MSFWSDPFWLCREIWRDATPLCRCTLAVPFIVLCHGAALLLLFAAPIAWFLIWVHDRLARHLPKFWENNQ